MLSAPHFGFSAKKKGSDVENDSLEREFRQILFLIKPYILRIEDQNYLEQYKVWLEKLSSDIAIENGTSLLEEKRQRNKFLLELANQIQESTLKSPFTHKPPKGSLLGTLPVSKSREMHQKKNKIKTFKKLGKIVIPQKSHHRHVKGGSTSSWCDLSGSNNSSTTTLASGDEYNNKNIGKNHNLEGMKVKQMFLEKYEKSLEKTKTHQNPEEKELEALKMRMKDLEEVKKVLTLTHCLTQDRKKASETLQSRVEHYERENTSLKLLMCDLNKKIKELQDSIIKNQEDHSNMIRELKSSHERNLDEFKLNSTRDVGKISQDFLLQVENLKKSNDLKIRQLEELHKMVLSEKEDEINRLKLDLRGCSEGSNEEVIHLKRCVSKMDKLLNKSEKDYLKKIEKLKQELEIKDMTMEMKLQSQKAELMFRNSSDRQEELASAISLLEVKYKNMLEQQLAQALEEKIHSSKKEQIVDGLRKFLDSSQIS